MSLKIGDIISFERQFTVEDVELFTQVSKDEGIHHITPDSQGRIIIQGLLTATLPTKIGGDHNVLARTMNFEFLRPVYAGDTVVCTVRVVKYEKRDNNRTAITTAFSCQNQSGREVLRGSFSGVILSGP